MSFTPYSPSDQWHGQLNVPDNGEADTSANLFDATAKYNADNALYLYNRSLAAKGGTIPLPNLTLHNDNDRWTYDAPAGIIAHWTQTDVTDRGGLLFPVSQFFGAKLTALAANFEGSSGHGAMPDEKPRISLYKIHVSSDTHAYSNVAGPQIDPETDTAEYEKAHYVTLTLGTAFAFDPDVGLFLMVEGEAGTGSQINLSLGVMKATYAPE